jgi:hypothetical protein
MNDRMDQELRQAYRQMPPSEEGVRTGKGDAMKSNIQKRRPRIYKRWQNQDLIISRHEISSHHQR